MAGVGQHFVITVIARDRGADFGVVGLGRAYRKLSQRPRSLLIKGDPGGMFPRKLLKFRVYFSPEKMFSNVYHRHSVSFLQENSHLQLR